MLPSSFLLTGHTAVSEKARQSFWSQSIVAMKNREIFSRLTWAPLTVILLLLSAESLAQSNPIDDIRDVILENLSPGVLGAGYSAMVNFAASPDISAAIFYPDEDDSTLNVYKLPYRHVFNHDSKGWRPFVQALVSYQVLEAGFDLFEGESIDSEWTAYSGSLSGGVEVPINDGLVFLTSFNMGLARLKNRANYQGLIANGLLKPALTGVIFDWDADAFILGGAIGLDYRHGFSNFDFETRGSLTYNHIETYGSSSEFVEFNSGITTFDIEISSVHPTNLSIGNFPLAVVTLLGNTTFLGPYSDSLGFNYFFEAGAALEADISSKEWKIKKVRLGATGIFGTDVTGWSIIFGYRY